MTECEDTNKDEAGKTIKLLQELGTGLAEDTNTAENRYRPIWTELVTKYYIARPGRPIVHLSDLTPNCMVYLRSEGVPVVQSYWDKLVASKGLSWTTYRHHAIKDYVRQTKGQIARLKKWKEFASRTNFDLDRLEPHVTALRVSDGPHIRMLNGPKLPLDLATPSGARLIGYYGDANNRNGAFTNKDPNLHQDYRQVVREVFGDLSITETIIERGGFGPGRYIRTNVGYLIPAAMSVAGFDNSRYQKQANSPFPSWLFYCPTQIKSECLSALWDAEGNIRPQDVKVGQAAPVTLYPENEIPSWPSNKPYRELTLDNQFRVLDYPPLLLVSAALLLYSMGIVGRLSPQKVYRSGDEVTAYWLLRLQREHSIQAFHSQIRLKSKDKQQSLDDLTG